MRMRTFAVGIALLSTIVVAGRAEARKVGKAFSFSSASLGIPLDNFTTVARRVLPAGVYAVTTTGVVRNSSGTDVAYVSCVLSSNDAGVSINQNDSEMLVPIALSAGVPGSGTWSIATTVTIPPGGGRVSVVCGSFGPSVDANLEAYSPSIVAVSVASDDHKSGS